MPSASDGIYDVGHNLRPLWRADGLPVVFNRGIGANLDIWTDWVPMIAARDPMGCIDLRGFGRSTVSPKKHS